MKTFEQIYIESSTNATLSVGYADKPGELRATSKKTDQQGKILTWYSFSYDGDTGVLSLGDHMMGLPGRILLGVAGTASQSILLDSATSTVALGGPNAGNGMVRLKNRFGTEAASIAAETTTLTLGAQTSAGNDTADGKILLKKTDGTQTILLEARTGTLVLGGGTEDGDLTIKSNAGANAIVMDGSDAVLTLGGSGLNGDVRVDNESGTATIYLDGKNGKVTLGGGAYDGDLTIMSTAGKPSIELEGSDGVITVGGEGVNGDIIVKNNNDIETIRITGSNGDIEFLNADVAEEFDVQTGNGDDTAPGTVMVLDDSGRLMPCCDPYDSRVVGVVAGAGQFRPGIVLHKTGGSNRRPIALVGKTYCRVDADAGPIRVGDLLTTSGRKGHAMRASDRAQAFGSVIGKALEPLAAGIGLIPVLVKPQ